MSETTFSRRIRIVGYVSLVIVLFQFAQIVLKLTEIISWSWWAVLVPSIAYAIYTIAIFSITLIALLALVMNKLLDKSKR